MKRFERKLWRSATTLSDLGDLTARWLDRDIEQHPGYPTKAGPDPETRQIARELAAINRAGFVTYGSQPGVANGLYRQRAAADGFTTPTIARLLKACSGGRIKVIIHPRTLPHRTDYSRHIPVTMYGDNVETHFGAHLSKSDIHLDYDLISQAAFDALYDAVQVTVVGLEWGDNFLWEWLCDALNARLDNVA
jgi:hypothetical protein